MKKLNQIDELGGLLAQIATLSKRAEAIKTGIKDAALRGGPHVVEGDLFRAICVEADRKSVDYKKLISDIGLSDEKVAEYVTSATTLSVKVTARISAIAA